MRLEKKFLRLKTPVTVGSHFGDWRVCWLGGWTRHQLSYIVMVVRAVDSGELIARSASKHRRMNKKTPPGKYRRR
jgi:hypothetical protein